MRTTLSAFAALLVGLTTFACKPKEFTQPMVLGGVQVSAESLNNGKELYMRNCFACHGEQGNGQGPAAAYLRPPPRDFATGLFKFGLAIDGLPHTEDLMDLVRRGLTGTAMLPWDVPDTQLRDIVHYLQSFSYAYRCEPHAECEDECARPDEEGGVDCYRPKKLGKRIDAGSDPWAGRSKEAVERGEVVYHINAQCAKCHPAYVTQEKFFTMTRGDNEWAYGELLYRSKLRQSDEYKTAILPIDFLYHPIKNLAEGMDEAAEREMLFKVMGAGVNGAAMPTWKGSLADEDLWALSYYVQKLYRQRNTPEGYALRNELISQPPFAPEGTEGEDGGEGDAQTEAEPG